MVQDTVVGLDVHAQSITAAILQAGSEQPEVVTLSADLMKVRRFFRRLSEAGPVRSCASGSSVREGGRNFSATVRWRRMSSAL